MKKLLGAMFIASLALVGCGDKGKLFVWNGGDAPLIVTLAGAENEELALAPGTGKMFERASAGAYTMVTSHADGTQTPSQFELGADKVAIVNLDAAACFARIDISGMYTPGKERVILLESYDKRPVLTLDDIVHVYPGEPTPPSRPKSAYAFQRMYQVPCDVVNDRVMLTEHVRKLK